MWEYYHISPILGTTYFRLRNVPRGEKAVMDSVLLEISPIKEQAIQKAIYIRTN